MQTPADRPDGIQNFVFVTTEVAYKELSDAAFQLQMTVAQFVHVAVVEKLQRELKAGRIIDSGQEETT